MAAPTRARPTASARCATARRMTAERLFPIPLATSSSIRSSSSSLNRVGTGVVIRFSIRIVEQPAHHRGPAPEARRRVSPRALSALPSIRSVRTEVIYELFEAGESIEMIAGGYDLPREDIEAAIRFEAPRPKPPPEPEPEPEPGPESQAA